MIHNKFRYILTLVALFAMTAGAWAQSTLNVVELDVPATWATDDNPVTAGDLPGFKASTLAEAQAWTGAPASGMALLFYDFDGAEIKLIIFSGGKNVGSGTQSYLKSSISTSNYKFYYTAEPTEWSLTPDETGKTWTLAEMPASDVELQVEYFAESNLFLSKEALADKTSIDVTAGDLGVQFGNDGKSANTVTEGTEMTVKYNGTKKLLGMKVAKKAPALLSIEISGHVTATIYYFEGETWEEAIQNHPTENSAWSINNGHVSGNGPNLTAGGNYVSPDSTIDPKADYHLWWT